MKITFRNTLKGGRLVLKRNKPTLKTAQMIFKMIDENRDHLKPRLEWVD